METNNHGGPSAMPWQQQGFPFVGTGAMKSISIFADPGHNTDQ
jgi:hypothetical protein